MPDEVAEMTRAQRKMLAEVERSKELEQCLADVKGVLESYNATFHVTRIVTVGTDGIERVQVQVSVVSL